VISYVLLTAPLLRVNIYPVWQQDIGCPGMHFSFKTIFRWSASRMPNLMDNMPSGAGNFKTKESSKVVRETRQKAGQDFEHTTPGRRQKGETITPGKK